MLAFYTDNLSVSPGDAISLYASSSAVNCRLEVARIGRDRRVVHVEENVRVGDHPVPPEVERLGCGWPSCCSILVGDDWPPGYYDLLLKSSNGERAHHFVCVRKAVGATKARSVLVLSTNTYHAYNWWGGRNAYCDVSGLYSGNLDLVTAMQRGVGVLSARRPFPTGLVAYEGPDLRLVNRDIRGFNAAPLGPDAAAWRENGVSTFDVAAGFLNKWEHAFVEWSERNQIPVDFLTDYDVEKDPECLNGYSAAIVVGHSEYWSLGQRRHIEDFVDAGGNLAILSGNTSYWKVRWSDDGATMVCHRWRGDAVEPDAGGDGTGMWSEARFGKPEAALIGLSFLFGGYHRLGLCAARGAGAYTIYNEGHWALDGADLFYGDQLGPEIPLLGYENDGCLFDFDDERLLKPIPRLGVPANLEIIAVAPCSYGEDLSRGYPAMLPAEDLGFAARVAYGDSEPATVRKLLRGHAVMASFKRGRGEVFNVGTTEWAHALNAGHPMVERITLNVLRRFGALEAPA